MHWCEQVAGTRRHPSLDGAAPAAVFAAVEAPALKALPKTPFVVATWSTGKVAPDLHVKVGPALYSVPWRLIGQQVEARSTATAVQIVHDGTVVATHVRAQRGRATNYDHYPPEKVAFQMRTPTWCRTTAAGVGPHCVKVIEELMSDGALFRLRAAQGILALRTTYGADALERSCAAALTAGDPSYRTIKGILKISTAEGADAADQQAVAARAAAVPALLRGPDDLFAAEKAPTSAVVVHPPVASPTPATSEPTSTNPTGTNPTGTNPASAEAAR